MSNTESMFLCKTNKNKLKVLKNVHVKNKTVQNGNETNKKNN